MKKVRKVMGEAPRVSIGMPVYNGERYLEEALDSVLTQTFEDFELVICDNASTDRTESICQKYLKKDQRIKYFRNEENRGAAYNYNRVFELSRGQYFKWAAADDLIESHMLEKCIAVLENDDSAVLCYPKTTIIDAEGGMITPYEDGLHLQSESVLNRFRIAIKIIRECNAVFGLIRSGDLKGTALIGNYPGSDRALLGELSLYGKFHEIPERLFFRRTHPEASSCNKALEDQQEFFDPKTKGNIFMWNWRHLGGYFSAVWRSSVCWRQKGVLFLFLLFRGVTFVKSLVREVRNSCVKLWRKFRVRVMQKHVTVSRKAS